MPSIRSVRSAKILLVLAALAPLSAQVSVSVLHRFAGQGCDPQGNLVQASDGSLYGSTLGSAATGYLGRGSVYRIAPDGTHSTLAEGTGTTTLDALTNSVVLGPDGNLYGLRPDGRTGRARTFYRVTPTGTVTTLFEFGETHGLPTSSLVLGSDGAFYGGAAAAVFRPQGVLSVIFRLTTTGTYSLVYPSAAVLAQNPLRLPPELQIGSAEHLIRTDDGTIIAAFTLSTSPTVFSIAPGGVPKNLLNDSPTVNRNEVVSYGNLSPGILRAADGTLYMGGQYNRSVQNPVIFRITPAGVTSILYTWPANVPQRARTIAPLVQGSDGNLYGASIDGGLRSGGFFYRLTPAGEYTVLHEFNPEGGFYVQGRMVQGPDGAFYVPASRRFVSNMSGFACGAILKIDAGLSVSAAPVINAGGVVELGSSSNTVQPGSWVSIFGSNLASGTNVWNNDFPTSLGGTSVTINGKPAYLWFTSPGQINLQAPDDDTTGPVSVVVTTAAGKATSTVTLGRFSPAFSLLDGSHVAGILSRADGSGAYGGGTYDIVGPTGNSLGYRTVAAKAGDALILFGVGFGPTTPSVAAGRAFAGSAPTSSPVTFRINGTAVTPVYSGLTSAGLYQFNLTLPAGLGSGDVPLIASVGGVQTPTGVVLSLQ